jgi:hypothetical protein
LTKFSSGGLYFILFRARAAVYQVEELERENIELMQSPGHLLSSSLLVVIFSRYFLVVVHITRE